MGKLTMEKIKQPSVAGMFYADNKSDLLEQIEYFKTHCKNDYRAKTRAIIVPHAGYMYSGQLAYEGIQYIDTNVKNIFIFAPAHRYEVRNTALSSYDEWETPLGTIAVNQEISKILEEKFGAKYVDEAFESEHSAEVQVPFIQSMFENVTIVPILIGSAEADIVKNIINYFYDAPENAFIISSDLSHFHDTKAANEIDHLTAEMIESNDVHKFSYEQACGAVGICGLVTFAAEKQYSLVRVAMSNSGDATGDNERVVGYGSWLLYEGEKNQFIKEQFTDYIFETCKASIKHGLGYKEMTVDDLDNIPEVFNEYGACFVTLKINGQLRGCIGSIVAHRTLIEDIISNSYNAAFSDPRFKPLEQEEFEHIKIAVSLLSTPTKMDFKNEDDFMSQIVQAVDGIIIRDGNHQAVYLPSVWEDLPDKYEFISSLKMKAGLPPDYFSETFEAYKYHVIYVE